jgi:hypothetical protein
VPDDSPCESGNRQGSVGQGGPALTVTRTLTGQEAELQGIEPDDVEMAYRHGYQHGAVETFSAVERFLEPTEREALRAWINDVAGWRAKAMLGLPPMWRLRMLGR